MIHQTMRLGLPLLAFGVLSCKPVTQTSNLAVTVGPKPTTALPVAIKSCGLALDAAADLASPSFEFTTFQYTWSGSNPMKIAYVQIDFKSGYLSSGKYQCVISGDKLVATLGSNQEISDNTLHKSICGLRCGGMAFKSTVSSVYLVGNVKVVGTEVDGEGNATPFVTDVDVALQYTNPDSGL